MFGSKVLLLLVAITIALAATDLEKWKEYKKKFNKNYPNETEDAMRMQLFLKDLAGVEKFNEAAIKNGSTDRQGVNQFSDWFPEEKKKWMLGTLPPKSKDNKGKA